MPAKFSERNNALDHTPIMAMLLSLSDEQKKAVLAGVKLANKPVQSTDAKAAQELPWAITVHDLGPSANDPMLAKLKYVRTQDRVLLIDAPNRIVQMIFAGVFDRFPALNVVVAEVDCGGVPYFKEQIDNNYKRLDAISDFRIPARPSEYVERHMHVTYLTNPFGIDNRPSVRRARTPRARARCSLSRGACQWQPGLDWPHRVRDRGRGPESAHSRHESVLHRTDALNDDRAHTRRCNDPLRWR